MFNSKVILASTLAALVSFTVASPAKKSPDAGTTIIVCTGTGCLPISVSFGVCTNLNDALSGGITSVQVPDGLICTFFEGFGCSGAPISLPQGTWDFPFDKQARSLNCSPQ
ncbi:hypothetical protein MVEN_00475500 [Mycena venus]|uniref:Hydrophobin n=1 Tax=Mycena venus TaxID=2733690 RepID=A0A8H7DBW9_9AGAR|nr:hypothetical protein MVEN_00475500 [Mycena venus]